MPPMMMTGISNAQNALAVARQRWGMGSGSRWGISNLRKTSRHAINRPAPMISPGTMPEMKSAEIEVLVVTP